MLLTVKEAAKQLGVSPALIYTLCAKRKLKHERHGVGRGHIRISKEAISEYREKVTVNVSEEKKTFPPHLKDGSN